MIVQRGVRRLPDHFRLAVFFGSFFERKSKKPCGRSLQNRLPSLCADRKSAPIFLRTFGLTQKYQKVKHGEKLRVTSPSLTERAQKTPLFAHPLRAFAPAPPLLPRFSQCGRASLRLAKKTDSNVRQGLAYLFAGLCSHILLAGRRPACPRDVKMSGEEADAHRAPGTIVRNSAVFRDRSARCAAASRSFSPRGLLWLFLRKKEQENLRVEACETSCPAFAQTSAGRGFDRAALKHRCLAQTEVCNIFFLRTSGLTQKYQKVKHGEKPRVSSPCICAGLRPAKKTDSDVRIGRRSFSTLGSSRRDELPHPKRPLTSCARCVRWIAWSGGQRPSACSRIGSAARRYTPEW